MGYIPELKIFFETKDILEVCRKLQDIICEEESTKIKTDDYEIIFPAPQFDSEIDEISIRYNSNPIMFYTKLKLSNITYNSKNMFIIDEDWVTNGNFLLIEGEIHVDLIIGSIYSEITFTSTTKNASAFVVGCKDFHNVLFRMFPDNSLFFNDQESLDFLNIKTNNVISINEESYENYMYESENKNVDKFAEWLYKNA